tara:strand:+ start:2479 stop:3234 length:756 start_codon:yes stop_codon:yes gene_type:complete
MKYVIPSYGRSKILQEKTLKYLDSMEIDRSDVYVFIREDDTDYEGYEGLSGINLEAIDIKGIGETHNYITTYFEADEFIVEIDDDLENIVDNERKPIESFKKICIQMKEKMEEVGASYGGTYSVANPMFMSNCDEYTTSLSYMLGCIRFRFVRKEIKVETNYAEDMENIILHFIRDKKILKNNWIAPKTKNYADGGCNGDGRDFHTEQIDKKFLAEKYPLYCRYFERKNGKPDCRVREYKNSTCKERFKKL